MTLLEKLRTVAALKVGDPFPECLGGPNNWGPPLSELCAAAADEIERLSALAGAASAGPSFAELKSNLPQRDPHSER